MQAAVSYSFRNLNYDLYLRCDIFLYNFVPAAYDFVLVMLITLAGKLFHKMTSYPMLITTFFLNAYACQRRQILPEMSNFAKHCSLSEIMFLILRNRV